MSTPVGKQLARGFASVIHLIEGHPRMVLKCPSRLNESHFLHKEAKRLSQLPNVASIAFIPLVEATRALMERLFSIQVKDLTSGHIERVRSDVVSVLQTLHGCGIVHADVLLQNIMLRHRTQSFVLIDLGGTAGASIYPLVSGYGARGRGGDRHRPPHEEGPFPLRTMKGDYYRMAMIHQRKRAAQDALPLGRLLAGHSCGRPNPGPGWIVGLRR